MKTSKKMGDQVESIKRYTIPLVIVAVLFVLVVILFKGNFDDILRLLMPTKELAVKPEEQIKPIEKMSPPAGIEKPVVETKPPRKPEPDSSIAKKEIDSYLNSLLQQQIDEYSVDRTTPTGSEMLAARKEPAIIEKELAGENNQTAPVSPRKKATSDHDQPEPAVSTSPEEPPSPPADTRIKDQTSGILKSPGATSRSEQRPSVEKSDQTSSTSSTSSTVFQENRASGTSVAQVEEKIQEPSSSVSSPAPISKKALENSSREKTTLPRETHSGVEKISPSEQQEVGLTRLVRKTPSFPESPGGDIILKSEINSQKISLIKIPFPTEEKILLEGADLLIMPGQEVWVKGKKIPIDEMIRIIREKRPVEQNELFGLRVVRPGDNIWNIHFNVIKSFFWNQRKIRLSPLIDEPDEKRQSSGVGKILKYSEFIGVSYNLITSKIKRNPNILSPGQEVYFFRMKDILSVLEGLNVDDLNKFKYNGQELFYLGQRSTRETIDRDIESKTPKANQPLEIKVETIN